MNIEVIVLLAKDDVISGARSEFAQFAQFAQKTPYFH